MSDPPEDPPESTGTPTLPKIPWPILLRYHLRKALRWRPWGPQAPSFELGKQLTSACPHFLKAYFWIMLPLVLGLFLGTYALLWSDTTIHWQDPHTWPNPWMLIKEVHSQKYGWISLAFLPAYLPVFLAFAAGWINLLYLPLIISWYISNIRSDCEPDYGRWVPGMTALQACTVALCGKDDSSIVTWFLIVSYTATAALITAYLGWWRPRRLLHEIDTERDLMLEDRMDEAMTEQGADSEQR